MRRPNRAVRRHRRGNAQAIIETALVIPIMLFLITGFIGLMIQVELQQELDSATKLAAESTFQTSRGSHDANTSMPRRCRYAGETFEGTVSFFNAGDGSDAVFNGRRLSSPTSASSGSISARSTTTAPWRRPSGSLRSRPTAIPGRVRR